MIYKILGKYIIVNKYNSGMFDNKKNATSFGYKKNVKWNIVILLNDILVLYYLLLSEGVVKIIPG